MTDWGTGEYERTARALEPAAHAVVDRADPQPGEHVLDVACGTGNAALLAAQRGARVLGVDLSERLLEVAAERAAVAGTDASFRHGDATALPVDDADFDVVVSVFGVIFADARAAAGELLRAVRPGGRIAISAWLPDGPVHGLGELVREALGQPARPATWSDAAVLRELFGGHEIHIEEHAIPFEAASVDAWLDDQFEHEPMWIEAIAGLERAGRFEAVREQARRLLGEANEEPLAFRTTSRYLICAVTRAD